MKRIFSLDFIRDISTFAIMLFHFNIGKIDTFISVGKYGGYTGGIFVAIFFAISGFGLSYTTKKINISYYKRRVQAIYPTFWLAFIYFYIKKVCSTGAIFYAGQPSKIVLSILGIDGFMEIHGFPTYYLVGEWFLGYLIILYFMYPILKIGEEKSEKLFSAMIILLFSVMNWLYMFHKEIFCVEIYNNFITCLICFWFGILTCKYRVLLSSRLTFVCGIFLVIIGYEIPDGNMCNLLIASGLFLILYYMGEYIGKVKVIAIIFAKLSTISYAFYLLHHQFIYETASLFRKDDVMNYYKVLVFTLIITIAGAMILERVNRSVLIQLKSIFRQKYVES